MPPHLTPVAASDAKRDSTPAAARGDAAEPIARPVRIVRPCPPDEMLRLQDQLDHAAELRGPEGQSRLVRFTTTASIALVVFIAGYFAAQFLRVLA